VVSRPLLLLLLFRHLEHENYDESINAADQFFAPAIDAADQFFAMLLPLIDSLLVLLLLLVNGSDGTMS